MLEKQQPVRLSTEVCVCVCVCVSESCKYNFPKSFLQQQKLVNSTITVCVCVWVGGSRIYTGSLFCKDYGSLNIICLSDQCVLFIYLLICLCLPTSTLVCIFKFRDKNRLLICVT